MDITDIAFLVDGISEDASLKAWISKHYNKKPNIRKTPGNGHKFSSDTYAQKAAPIIIQNLNSNIHAIIIIPDFERRGKKDPNITINGFAEELKTKIIEEVCKNSKFSKGDLSNKIFVCPSNIMFENWIVCDVDGIKQSKEIAVEGDSDYYDGDNGATILKGMIKNKDYHKSTDAHRLFKKVRKDVGKHFSPSFENFISTLDNLLS